MEILFIADPLDQFKIYKDTTYAMMAEAARRGYCLYVCEPAELALADNIVEAQVRRFVIVGGPHASASPWYRAHVPQIMPLQHFDAVLMRKDPPFDLEYVVSTWLLELAERAGARIFNRPRALRDHSEKLAIGEFPQFIPPTLVTRDAARLRAFHAQHRDIILKPLDGMGGMGIFRVKSDGMNLGVMIETLSNNGARTVMAQKFITEIADGDKRILLIGGKVVPYALARIPQGNEVRGNLAVGGLGRVQSLSARDTEIVTTLGPLLAERGLLLVGFDTIGDWLTEVNLTSPTGFQEITEQTGINVAAMFIDALEQACETASKSDHF